MAFEGFYDCDHTIMATDPQVIALGHIVSQDHSRALADSGEDGEQNASL
jgi:hypothetical protein